MPGETRLAFPAPDSIPHRARVVKWQTRTFEGRMPQGMGVQVPPRALLLFSCSSSSRASRSLPLPCFAAGPRPTSLTKTRNRAKRAGERSAAKGDSWQAGKSEQAVAGAENDRAEDEIGLRDHPEKTTKQGCRQDDTNRPTAGRMSKRCSGSSRLRSRKYSAAAADLRDSQEHDLILEIFQFLSAGDACRVPARRAAADSR